MPFPPWGGRFTSQRCAAWLSGIWATCVFVALICKSTAIYQLHDSPIQDASLSLAFAINIGWTFSYLWAIYGGNWNGLGYGLCTLVATSIVRAPDSSGASALGMLIASAVGLLVFTTLQVAFPFDTRLRRLPAIGLCLFALFCAASAASTSSLIFDSAPFSQRLAIWESRWASLMWQNLITMVIAIVVGPLIEHLKLRMNSSMPGARHSSRQQQLALLVSLVATVVFCILWTLAAEVPVREQIQNHVLDGGDRSQLLDAQRGAALRVGVLVATLLGAVSGGAAMVLLLLQRYREQLRAEIQRGTEALRRRHIQLAALQKVTEASSRTLDPQSVLREMAQSIAGLTDAAQVSMYVPDSNDTSHLKLVEKVAIRPQNFQHPERLSASASLSARSFRTGTIVSVPQSLSIYTEDDPLRAEFAAHKLEAFISMPIVGDRATLGILNLAFDRPYGPDEDEYRLFRLIGDAAGTALERAETYAKAKRYAGELGGLYRFSQQLADESEARRMLVAATVAARRLLKARTSAMFLVDSEGASRKALCAAYDSSSTDKASFFRQLEIDSAAPGLIAEAIREARTTGVGLRSMAAEDQALAPDWSEKSALVVPLPGAASDAPGITPAGALVLVFDGKQAIGLEASGLAEELARQIGASLKRARLIETTRQQADELALLERVGRSLAQNLSIAGTLEQLVQNVSKIITARWATVFVHNANNHMIMVRATNFTQPGAKELSIPVNAQSLVATCLREGRTLIAPDMRNDPRCSKELNQRFDTASGICVPLGPAGRRFGVLMANNSVPGEFPAEQIQRLEQVAQLASTAIERARLYEDACQRADELILLNEVGHLLVENPALESTLQRIAELVCRQFQVSCAGFLLLNEKRNALVSHGVSMRGNAQFNEAEVSLDAPGVTVEALRRNQTVVIEDTASDPRVNPILFKFLPEARSGVVIPLSGPRGALGILGVVHNHAHTFAPRDLQCLGGIARLAAAAVSREELGQALRASEERLQEIVDGIQAMVVSIDRRGHILSFNAAAERISGRRRDAVLGENLATIVSAKESEKSRLQSYLVRAFETLDCSSEILLNWQPVHGTERKIRWSASFLRGADGAPTGMVCFGVDITEQKLLEAQLLQAQKMESVGALAGGMAHDFNNLLGGIIGQCALARAQMAPHDLLQGAFAKIEAAAHRGADLTSKLLAFARKSVLQPRSVDVEALIKETTELLSGSLPRSIQIVTRVSSPLPQVHGDPTQLQQVLLNLCVNARDAMPNGGSLTVAAAPASPLTGSRTESSGIVIEVIDSGTGMSDDVQQHLFEPFFTTKELGKGTGLGLSLVFGIVRSHGGQINCFSQLGKGTRFVIRLPALLSMPGGIRAPVIASRESQRIDAGLSGMQRAVPFSGSETLLLVDDDAILRDTMQQLLQTLGYKVETAAHGLDALKRLDQKSVVNPSVVLLDVVMPGMAGLPLYNELRKRLPATPVILMSGYSADETVTSLLNAGARELIQKPFAIDVLAGAIRRALDAVTTK